MTWWALIKETKSKWLYGLFLEILPLAQELELQTNQDQN